MKVNVLQDCVVKGKRCEKGATGIEVDDVEGELLVRHGHLEDVSGAVATGEYDPKAPSKRVNLDNAG